MVAPLDLQANGDGDPTSKLSSLMFSLEMSGKKARPPATTLIRRAQRIGHRLADEAEGIHQSGFPGAIATDEKGDIVEDQTGVGERSVVAEPEFPENGATHRDETSKTVAVRVILAIVWDSV